VSLVVDEHRQYLADQVRVSAFRDAIAEVVTPGAVVLDVGAGTGILGLLACQAGARHVYSIEAGGIIGLARSLARANGVADRITFVKGLSTRVDVIEPVDVVVGDQAGRFGFEAGLLTDFPDAARRFLKPGGVTIPSRVDMWVAPVEHAEKFAQVTFWSGAPGGFDFTPAGRLAMNTGYPARLEVAHLLADAVSPLSLDPAVDSPHVLKLDASVVARRPGTLHGIGGWFSAAMSPGVTMTNSPLARERIGRLNVFFPIERAVPIAPGDRIDMSLRVLPAEFVVTWRAEVWRAGACTARSSHSTLNGMLVTAEDLRATRPDFVPKLSAWGEARRTILELCDGQHTLAAIEHEVLRRHPDLFASLGLAAEFVAEVVTRYAA
jgi:protein arginine N-methyltransferase 1